MYIFTHIQNIFLSADMHLYKGVWLSYLFMNLSVRLCVCASIFPSLVPIWLICFGSINVLISTATAWPVLAYWLLFMNKLLPWKSLWVFYVLVFHHYGCMKLACAGRFFSNLLDLMWWRFLRRHPNCLDHHWLLLVLQTEQWVIWFRWCGLCCQIWLLLIVLGWQNNLHHSRKHDMPLFLGQPFWVKVILFSHASWLMTHERSLMCNPKSTAHCRGN